MKQTLLIVLLTLGLFSSCIKEEYEECPGYLRFTFVSEGSTQEYDQRIGNDVHLRIYKDNVLYSAGTIPYDKIKGGKEYLIQKEFTGEVDVVAWAVPSREDFVAQIPAIAEDRSRTGELLSMTPLTRSTGTYQSMGHLYLGTQTREEEDLRADTHFQVAMNTCIAQFTATIHNIPELYQPGEDETVWMHVYGTKSQMDTEFNPLGEDAVIVAEFTQKEEENHILKTNKYGLLASAPDQYISVDIYKGDTHQGTIKTDIQSVPGKDIHLDIYRHTVTIYINGWRIFDVNVEWI